MNRNSKILVSDLELQPESSLLVCVSEMLKFQNNTVEISESVFGVGHIFNRWPPLRRGGNGLG